MKSEMKRYTSTGMLLVLALLSGCALSPPKPALCDGTAKKPINGRAMTPVPAKISGGVGVSVGGCPRDA